MRAEKLIGMANQIAAFFRAYPEPEAVAGVHHHLVTFWTPTMIRTMRDHLAHHPAGADPLVVQSMQHDPHGPSPVDKVVSPMLGGGQIASDAG